MTFGPMVQNHFEIRVKLAWSLQSWPSKKWKQLDIEEGPETLYKADTNN